MVALFCYSRIFVGGTDASKHLICYSIEFGYISQNWYAKSTRIERVDSYSCVVSAQAILDVQTFFIFFILDGLEIAI